MDVLEFIVARDDDEDDEDDDSTGHSHFTSLTLSFRTLNFGFLLIFLLNRDRSSSSDL